MKTVFFYNVGIYYNDELTSKSVLELFDKINAIQSDRKKVLRKINSDKIVAIFPFAFHKDDRVRVMPFGKFRLNFKPFIGSLTESNLDKIDKDVIEVMTVFYHDAYKTACINFGQFSLRIHELEAYLNTFLSDSEGNRWEVKFEPIIVNKGLDRVKKSKQIKSIELELNLKSSSKSFINKGADDRLNVFESFFKKVEGDFDASHLKLEFGIGRKRKHTIDLDNVFYFLSMLNIDTDYIKVFNVEYMDSTTQKFEVAKLKNLDVEMKDYINFTGGTPAPEFLSNEINGLFDKNKGNIVRAFLDFPLGKVVEDYEYLFFIDPKEKNTVRIKEITEKS